MSTVPTTMKWLRIVEPGKSVWEETPVPTFLADEALVRVLGVTTCPHWDIHMMNGEPMFAGSELTYPLIPGQPGHEAMGEVVAIGENVRSLKVGDHVAVWQDPGNRRQGCYAQFVPIRETELLMIDKALPPASIASLELAMCVQGSFFQLQKRDALQGKRVAVSGLGPSGLIAIQMARAYGASEVIGLELDEGRRKQALKIGADVVLNPITDPIPTGRNANDAFDSALDTTGLKVSIELLMAATRNTVAIFGVLREKVTFGPEQWFGDFALLGYASHTRQAAEEAYRLIREGKLRLDPLVSETLPFSAYPEGVELLRSKTAQKVLFTPWN